MLMAERLKGHFLCKILSIFFTDFFNLILICGLQDQVSFNLHSKIYKIFVGYDFKGVSINKN